MGLVMVFLTYIRMQFLFCFSYLHGITLYFLINSCPRILSPKVPRWVRKAWVLFCDRVIWLWSLTYFIKSLINVISDNIAMEMIMQEKLTHWTSKGLWILQIHDVEIMQMMCLHKRQCKMRFSQLVYFRVKRGFSAIGGGVIFKKFTKTIV